MTEDQKIFSALAADFHESEIRSRSQAGRTFRYITARIAMNRLDEVLGGSNWKDEYTETEKGLKCRLWFRIPGTEEWLWKEDGGAAAGMQDSDNDEKSAYSDAFKRAAVKLGVGRFLYNDGIPIYPQDSPPAAAVASPTGKGSGLGTKQHMEKTRKFNEWVTKQCDTINRKWHEEWDARCDRAMQEGYGVPSKIPDVINPWGFKGHLVKWAVETERLDPSIVPEDIKVRQNDALCALVFFRSIEEKEFIIAEMGRYLQEQRLRKSEPIYRKHPELAPDGYFEEQEQADTHGDAWEPSDQDYHDAAEAGSNA